MLSRYRSSLLALVLLGLIAPAAHAAGSLPPVQRTVTAPVTKAAGCTTGGTTTYRAPMAGYLNVDLDGTGDWDLTVRGAGDRSLGSSLGFRGSEVVQDWVSAGEVVTAVACRHPGATGAAKVAFTLVDAKPVTQRGATRVARVRIARQAQVARLERRGFDTTHRQTPHSADVLINGDAELAKLRRTGLPFRIVTRNLYTHDLRQLRADAAVPRAAGAGLPSGRTTYRTYADYGTDLKKLVDDNPGLVRPVTLGKSFQGRDISGVEIANDVKADDGRPVYFVMGVHHAREWPAGEAAMELATLLTKSKSDPRIAKILATERVVVVPLINPDGFVVSRSSLSPSDAAAGSPLGCPEVPGVGMTTCDTGQLVEAVAPPGGFGAYRRKNCDGGDPMQPCETKYGVDNNRNYGNLWGGPGGSPDITSQSYHGPAPRSEPETQAVFDYVRTHEVTTLITLHTVAGLVLRPPGLAQVGFAPDEKRMKELGDAMATAAGYTSEYSFQLYDTAGTTEDDTYAATGGYGYTYELGTDNGPFHGPYQDSVIGEWTGENGHAKNRGGVREALLLGAEAAGNPSDHAVLKGSAPAGRVLHLTKSFKTKTSDYCPSGVSSPLNVQMLPSEICAGSVQKALTLDDSLDAKTTVPASGTFEWHVGQSTRPFVNGGAVFEKVGDPQPVATITGSEKTTTEKTFALPERTDRLTLDLAATGSPDPVGLNSTKDDYDFEVLKDGKSLGTASHGPASAETLVIDDAAAGTYTVRIIAAAVSDGGYEVTVTKQTVARTTTTGTKEAYTLTCEDKAGKVFTSTPLVIDRGQTVTADPCEKDNSTVGTVPPSLLPGASGKKVKIRFTGLRLRPNQKRRIRFRISSPKAAPGVARGRFRLVTTLKGKTRFVASRRFAIRPGTSRVVNPIVRKRVYRALRHGKRVKLRIRLTGTAGKLGLAVVTKNFAALKRPR